MSRYPAKRSRGGGSRVQVDPATALHDLITKLFDKAEGHGADWAAGAEALFRCGFSFLHNIPAGDPRADQIAPRVLDVATGLVAGSEDSGAAYTATAARPLRPAFTMTDPSPGHGHKRP